MSELEVRIEKLAPMRVACFRALGQSPEQEACFFDLYLSVEEPAATQGCHAPGATP